MVRLTTPDFSLTLRDDTIDLNEAANVYVTFQQGSYSVTKTGSELDVHGNVIDIWFSQEDMLNFVPGGVNIQINWTYHEKDGKILRVSTGIKRIQITRNLLNKVVE